ncbi:branched-chain amino acid ABC transporter permease [Halanaerobium congolense]|uniref:Amino acid/amide ABC transporter membrane protein 1, HAAT family n=1 Tax=Halanaerobium congolense TaxID=54121 RepID=A0A1G6PC34_9FIRM|nr:branched-chain amino acid ABC transporter permease [Halanaerobium congolense]SDC76875.1 amino acid/amide ABC transporter membrane protein 1, HAAT family [Halanaerobium congolense]
MDLTYIFQQVLNALSLGSMLALLAVGYTMIYGVLGLINFAHGEVFMIGAFTAMYAITGLGFPLPIALILAIIASVLAGVLLERFCYRPVQGSGDITLFITSLAASIGIRSLFVMLFGSRSMQFPMPKYLQGIRFWGDILITDLNLIIFVFTVIITLILSFFIKNTKLGIAMRGVSYNKQTAEAMGINSTSIIVATFVIGSALAAVAGVAWGLQYGNVRPAMGYHPGISGFIAAVLGGIGNISGTAISGFLLGVGQVLFVAFLPSVYSGFRPLFVWIVLFIILFYKPTGLFRSNIKWE